METIYKTPTDAAKGIRAELKAAFPKTKFSVRTEYFSMGNAIRISWSFGPTGKAVDAVVLKYKYGTFDSMTDCSGTEDTVVSCPDGEVRILGGAKFVNTSRDFRAGKDDWKSETAFLERVGRDLCALQGIEYVGRDGLIFPESSTRLYEVVNELVYGADLTEGYAGLRRSDASRSGFEVVTGAIKAEAPVAKAAAEVKAPAAEPALAPAEVKAEALAELAQSVAEEILNVYGAPLRTMSLGAIKSAVGQRCYLRYRTINREDVLRSVLALLTAEVAG